MNRLSFALVALALLVSSGADAEPGFKVVSGAPPAAELEVPSAGLARVYLYGGPGSLAGTFQDASGAPDWQGWTSVDMTQAAYEQWQVSTFNAETLGGHGVGNHAMWCGADDPAFATAPGYGSRWDAILEWRSGPLADPSVGQTVGLEFLFHYDTEDGYDVFEVQFLRDDQWVTAAEASGTDGIGGVFTAPGTSYAEMVPDPITYLGNDYPDGEIVIRLRFKSDSYDDDEDGLFDTTAGAVQVDDILVSWNDGGAQQSWTDFEGAGPFAWTWVDEIAGDLTKIMSGLSDLSACRQNNSPQMTFIDDGTPVRNLPASTGGYINEAITSGRPPYGYPWTGGLTADLPKPVSVDCRPVSPPIALDAPGSEDDGPGWRTHISYEEHYYGSVSDDLFLEVRASADGGLSWGAWELVNNFVFYSRSAPIGYRDRDFDVHEFIPAAATHVQIRFLVFDYMGVGIPPSAANAGPWIDNIAVYKVRTADEPDVVWWHTLLSSFPRDTGFDVATEAGRNALDIPLDVSTLNWGPGDSVVVEISPWDEATPPADVRMMWVLDRNPVFEDAIRSLPPGAVDFSGASRRGWDQWRGSFDSEWVDSYRGPAYAIDPPDVDFVYPGDEFRWYIQTTSSDGVVATDPAVLDGFETGAGYDLNFTMRAFPSVADQLGAVPSILAVHYGGHFSPQDKTLELALESIGFEVGVDIDVMYLYQPDERSTSLADSTKIGPSPAQMEGYETVLIFEPRLYLYDAAAVVPFLIEWQDLPGDRTVILFNGLNSLDEFDVGLEFWSRMGTAMTPYVTRSEFLGTSSPYVVPAAAAFSETVFHAGWCASSSRQVLDWGQDLDPVPPAFAGHVFSASSDGSGPTMNASIINTWIGGSGGTKTVITLPLYFRALGAPVTRDVGALEEARLLQELLEYSGVVPGGGSTDAPELRVPGIAQLRAHPNPFNPVTTISFRLGDAGRTNVDIFDVSGRRVRSLFDGPLPTGQRLMKWDGRSDNQARVASGVYFVRVQQAGHRATMKIALVE